MGSKAIKFRNKNNDYIYPCPYFPVGSIYLSLSATNPSTYFGGTWELIKDRFLIGAGGSYSVNATGGNSSHQHSLSSNGYAKISLHGSGETKYNELVVSSWSANFRVVGSSGGGISESSSWGASLGGKTDSGSTMPPYMAVYMWRRTA